MLADILHHHSVAPVAEAFMQDRVTERPEVDVPVNLYSRKLRSSLAVIEFGAGKFAASAANALKRVRCNEPGCLIHYN